MQGGPTVISTSEPERPKEPTFFRNKLTTSTCLHLTWDAPIYDGGRPITHFLIMYTVVEKHVTATSREHTVPKDKQIRTKGPETEIVIRNLPHSTKIINIKVRAVNDFEIAGPSALITWGVRNPLTEPCSRYYALKEEYLKTKEMEGDFCDTDFFTGITQRLLRVDHMKQLEGEMKVTEPTDLEKEEAAIWESIVDEERREAEEMARADKMSKLEDSDSSDDEDKSRVTLNIAGHKEKKKKVKESDFIFPHRVRKKHYKLKIINVDNDLENLEDEKVQIEVDRVANTTLLKERQLHLIKLELEKDRAFNFDGMDITSSVLQGIPLSYKITNFKEALTKAYEDCEADIARAKNSIIAGEKRKKVLGGMVTRKIEEKKDRQAEMKKFLNESEKQQRVMKNLLHGNHNREALLSGYFNKLRLNVADSLKTKANVTKALSAIGRKLLASAFEKWSTGKFSQSIHSSDFNGGVGSVMLQKSRTMREEVQTMLREALASTAEMSVKLKVCTLPHKHYKKLTSSVHIKDMEEGMSQSRMYESGGLTFLFEGDGYAINRKYKQAEDCYEAQIISIRSRVPLNIKHLAMCHGRLGKLYLRMERFDRAIVDFDRQMSLANEIGDKVEVAEAYYGLGSGMLGRFDFLEAIRYLEIAQSRYETMGNIPKHCGCLVAMKECYDRLGKPSLVEIYSKRIDDIEGELRNKLSKISSKLNGMTERLRLSSAALEMVVEMERITPVILDMRAEVDKLHDVLELQGEELESQGEKVAKVEKKLDGIQSEISEAIETDELAIISNYVHDQPQLVEVEELKTRLHEKKLAVLESYKVEAEELTRIKIQMKNTEDKIQGCDDEIAVELGELMKRTNKGRPFRCIAFNPGNVISDEVTGTATGGVENFACSESVNIHIIDTHSGELLHIFRGDNKATFGKKKGHTGVITALAYYDNIVYSGSADEKIMVWDFMKRARVAVLSGHDGTITALTVFANWLASGGADATIRLWNKITGKLLRVVEGHNQSILSIHLGSSWMATCSADEDVRVWSIHQKTKVTLQVETTLRLQGHDASVSCVRYSKLEVVSGDKKGDIIIWWVEDGHIVRHIKGVHEGLIHTIQFDATRIVSGGADNNVCVTDIGTGTVLQTLRGHTNQILAISFDTARILSAGRDSELRYWIWGEKREGAQDKYHTFSKGETLTHIAENYLISLETLMKWNGIQEMKEVYVGMRLLVRKADPTVFTKAEMKQFAKEKRMAEGQKYARDKMLKHALDTGGFKDKSRVYKLATDIDKNTLGNRLFGAEKQLSDLLPENPDNHRNWHSLGSRIRENTGQTRPFHGMPPRYFPSKANMDEWGDISDAVVMTMVDIFVEFQAYELVLEVRKQVRNKESIIGRTLMPIDEKIRRDVMSRGGKKCKKQLRIEEAQRIAAENEEARKLAAIEAKGAQSGENVDGESGVQETDADVETTKSNLTQSQPKAKKSKVPAVSFDKAVDSAEESRRDGKKSKAKGAVDEKPPMEKALSHAAGALVQNSEYDYHSSDEEDSDGDDNDESEEGSTYEEQGAGADGQSGQQTALEQKTADHEDDEDEESANLLADILGGGDGDY